MLIVLDRKHDTPLVDHIRALLQEKYNCESHLIGENGRVIAVPGDTKHVDIEVFENIEGVKSVDRVEPPYKLASRKNKDRTVITLRPDVMIGSRGTLAVMAGPCSIESPEQMDETAAMAKEGGVNILRGGAFKPRTGPYSFNGLGEDGLKLLKKAGEKYGMATISEAMNEEQIDTVAAYADIVQIGARNMQNYDLLRKAGTCKKPVMLKRGLAATLEEFLLAAEYILAGGNPNVILCERGIRTFEEEVRYTLCLGSLPALREMTHLPIIVDPSHAAGRSRWVKDLALAGVASGADGLIIEIHPRPEEALSDGPQSLDREQWTDCIRSIRTVAGAVGRTVV
ncbi:MAG: 3-deoxy-7-phosphoheptulonate synthase [Candidatus Peribacteraceae bacterium]|nr:3-deoxy-7-phosphoheptulonate synthase [Candidatus Peribacteraceae bacterium]